MENGGLPNGDSKVNGTPSTNGSRPRTPSLNTLSLTEYATNPSPPSADPRSKIRGVVPEEFLLPNGYPDPVFSFKLRGAYNKMAHLDPKLSWKGVVACSAGNHAQGVAYSARKLKIPATIVMPKGTPSIKHLNVSRLGGSVVLNGDDFDAAKEECGRLEKLHGLTNIPPFDDPYVIAGQGTIGMELLRQTNIRKLEAIFCCVGGGGLIAGIGVYVKRIAPHVKIIGVETYDANAMVQSLQKGERVALQDVGLFADGAAVKNVGEETFRICQEVVDEIIQVTTDETCAAIKDVFEDTRSIVEPAGALALAGLKKYVAAHPSADTSRNLVAIASGANMNFDRLRFVAERAALGEKKEALIMVKIPERPGAFLELIRAIMPHMVTEFSYRFATDAVANILIGISLTSPVSQREAELSSLLARIESGEMIAKDLSGDELAKSHVRYLVGGRSAVPNERLYMFNFPERPGALQKFLTTLGPKYNISLFQYRNAGSDIGKILTGIICPEVEHKELESFLQKIGYPWEDS
ncbi:putative Threonine dehydratase, mitochondrial [Glarea lozoyensis 74030]|uniref:Threonine dehydratase n=1 Tax=Glarea lozoyensis (strain ATCC 74030 / MF5533) TaxID=1104152 RepID=H0EM33_GLAL7|nr:putative Threonine dehydratase, mitochondrial [Glarea lozoyensis 74030]